SSIRVLHSFPTRRSSDLEIGEIHPAFGTVGVVGLHGDVLGKRFRECIAVSGWNLRLGGAGERASGLDPHTSHRVAQHSWQIANADRKSTRLNSSHGSISY